jgi:hypothetical protein
MNGYKEHDMDEDPFAAKAGSIVSAFDAFRECPLVMAALPVPIDTTARRRGLAGANAG